MNFDKLMPFVLSVVLAATAIGRIDDLQKWVWRKQAQIIYESRASSWGNPIILKKK